MEIPKNLKILYRHWKHHVSQKRKYSAETLSKELSWFISERIAIWEKKTCGEKPPLTKDPILQHYRFCNIFREFDKQTIEFHTLLNPLRDDFPLWLLNMFYCRMVARTETIKFVGLLSFDKKKNDLVYKKLLSSPRPRFGTPYVFPISAIQKSKTPTRELFICYYLPLVTKKVAKEITTWKRGSVYEGLQKVLPLFGFNLSFLWTEVLIDTAYQFPEYIDLFKRFPIGPGSEPTMRKFAGKEDLSLFVEMLGKQSIKTSVTYNEKPLVLSAENWEGVGCEFRKYTNLKQGKGRKRLYKKLKNSLV